MIPVDDDASIGRPPDAFDMTLAAMGDGTNLHRNVRMVPPNLLVRVREPMVRREILGSAALDLPTLKSRLEAG